MVENFELTTVRPIDRADEGQVSEGKRRIRGQHLADFQHAVARYVHPRGQVLCRLLMSRSPSYHRSAFSRWFAFRCGRRRVPGARKELDLWESRLQFARELPAHRWASGRRTFTTPVAIGSLGAARWRSSRS